MLFKNMVLNTVSTRVETKIFLFCVFLSLYPTSLTAAPVVSAEAPISVAPLEEARYRIYWNGIRLGKLWLYWKEDGERYNAEVSIKTSGVARVFSKQDRRAKVAGRMARNNGMEYYFPEKYEYFSKGKRKTREVRITYAQDGKIAHLSVSPPDDPKRRPPVSETGQNAAYDPLTALRAILHYAQNLSQGGHDTSSNFTVFDGRRLTRIVATPTMHDSDCGKGCVIAHGTRELVEGYTDEEKEEFAQSKEAPVMLEITPSIHRFPQKISTSTPLGTVYATRYK